MFIHRASVQYPVHVDRPDPRFATLLLEQFGGGNGELKAAMQYLTQSFGCEDQRLKDMLLDIGTEEFSHLEIVGTTITLLLKGVKGGLQAAAEQNQVVQIGQDGARLAGVNPEFCALSGAGPVLTNAAGAFWSGAYVNANGDPAVDLRSNIAAEARAKIVYDYLLRFTDDPGVKDALRFLMTREVAHMQSFQAALDSLPQNFPPGAMPVDPNYTHKYFNMSSGPGDNLRGPWNEGQGPWPAGESWEYIEQPVAAEQQRRKGR